MKLVAQLEELLHKYQVSPEDGALRLAGWRIYIHEFQSLAIGLKNNFPGGVYTPPSYRSGESGEALLVWADGKMSLAKVQGQSGNSRIWRDEMANWRLAAYEDPDGAIIPASAPLPLVAVEDGMLERIISGEDDILFAQLERLLKDKPAQANMQAHIGAAWGYRHIRTSSGLAVTYRESQYSLSYSFNRLVGMGFAKRRFIKPGEWTDMWQTATGYYEALQQEIQRVEAQTVVILAPSIVEEMLGQYILPNFSGQNVLEAQSAYRKESFEKQEAVFAPGVSLIVDPLRPLEWGSYLCTAEGVPAERTVLVREGRLKSPILRLKDAKRWGQKPTALPHGMAGLYLLNRQEEKWASVLEDVEDGVLILSVLGLHTQDSVAGDYSLSVPQGIRIREGRLAGPAAVKITGNFFKDLAAPSTRWARSERESQPYMLIRTGVENL